MGYLHISWKADRSELDSDEEGRKKRTKGKEKEKDKGRTRIELTPPPEQTAEHKARLLEAVRYVVMLDRHEVELMKKETNRTSH